MGFKIQIWAYRALVVVEPDFKKSEFVAREIRNADFEALFDQERVRLCDRLGHAHDILRLTDPDKSCSDLSERKK